MAFVKEKVALITGGVSGIGLSIAKNLLLNGAKGVALLDKSEENGNKVATALQNQYKDKVIFLRTDVRKEKDLMDAFEKTIETFKNIDIVCNNAGILDEVDWEETVAVNLTAVIRGTYLALNTYLPTHKAGKEAVIVNTASIMGLDTTPIAPTYCTTKHGVVGLGKTLGDEERYKKSGIRVLTVCPGLVDTPLKPNLSAINFLRKELNLLPNSNTSRPDYVGKSIVQIINEGQNGSVWVVEDEEEPYEVEFMSRVHIRKK